MGGEGTSGCRSGDHKEECQQGVQQIVQQPERWQEEQMNVALCHLYRV